MLRLLPIALWPPKAEPRSNDDDNAQNMPKIDNNINNNPTYNDQEETEDMSRRQRREATLQWCRANNEDQVLDWFGVDKELTRVKTRDFLVVTQPLTKPQGMELTDDAFELANALIRMPGVTLVAIGTYEVYVEVAQAFDIADSIIEEFENSALSAYDVNTEEVDSSPAMPESLDLRRNCTFVGAAPAVNLSK